MVGEIIKQSTKYILIIMSLSLLLQFQNCSSSSFSQSEGDSSSQSVTLDAGGDSYDGKPLIFLNYDQNQLCEGSLPDQPKVRFRLHKNNDEYQIEKGDCILKDGDLSIGGLVLPAVGSLSVDTAATPVHWQSFNHKVAEMDGQVFQVERSQFNNDLILSLVAGEMPGSNGAQHRFHIEKFKDAGGIERVRYVLGEYESANNTAALIGAPLRSLALSFTETVSVSTKRLEVQYPNGLLVVNSDIMTKTGDVSTSGDIGVPGGLNSNSIQLSESDLCDTVQPELGATCSGGAIYAGNFRGRDLMVTPGNCTDSTNPTCDGGVDTVTKTWQGNGGLHTDIPGVENVSAVDGLSTQWGDVNTTAIVAHPDNGPNSAARFCDDMVYGGFDDWYLPSKSEMAYLFCQANTGLDSRYPDEDPNCTNMGGKNYVLEGFSLAFRYWTSTEWSSSSAYNIYLSHGSMPVNVKNSPEGVRCVRSY